MIVMVRGNFMDWLSGTILAIGGLNWGLVGFFKYDLLADLFTAGSGTYRVLTGIVGLAAVYLIGAVLVRLANYDEASHAHA